MEHQDTQSPTPPDRSPASCTRKPGRLRKPVFIIGGTAAVAGSLLAILLALLGPAGSAASGSFDMHLTVSTALSFAKTARTSPTEAFSRHASPSAADHFRIIGERIWQTVSPELGWRWLFQGALMTVSSPAPGGLTNGAIVGWYHPWSDTALLTFWTITNATARIDDCEFVMGDVLRKRTLDRPSTTRAWARRRQYFAAAVGLTTAESLRSIELLTFYSNLPATPQGDPGQPASTNIPAAATPLRPRQPAWRLRIPFVLSPSNLEANHTGAGVMLLSAISDITRFSAPTNVFAIRVVPTLQQLHSPSNMLTVGPEAAATIRTLPKNFMSRFVPALYANSRQRAFLMLQAKSDPKRCLAFLFKLELPDGKELTPEDEKKQDEARARQITALTNLEDVGTNETPEQMYPEAHYPIKLIRADMLDLGAVYTNRYPVKRRAQ